MDKKRLKALEESVLDCFRRQRTTRLLAKAIFEGESGYTNADLVRAFEDLEKKWRLLIRYTEEGYDWVQLTPAGAERLGLSGLTEHEATVVPPHPPRSST